MVASARPCVLLVFVLVLGRGLALGIAPDLDVGSACLAQPVPLGCGPTAAAAVSEETSSLLQTRRTQAAPAPATPYLDLAQAPLRLLAPEAEGKLWKLTHGNVLPEGWLLQSPDCWGMDNSHIDADCGPNKAPGTLRLAERIEDVIASAKQWVDITTLSLEKDLATGIFFDHIVKGLVQLHRFRPGVTIRILGGRTPVGGDGGAKFFMKKLTEGIKSKDANAAKELRIFVAVIETRHLFSWSHAKIVAVDGRSAIVGGHNLWDGAYNSNHPVTDVSMHVQGPAAGMSHRMANILWGFACTNFHYLPFPTILVRAELARATGVAHAACPRSYSPPEAPVMGGSVSILAVGEMGRGMKPLDDDLSKFVPPPHASASACRFDPLAWSNDFNYGARWAADNPDWAAMIALIGSAKSSVFISQQDVLRELCVSTSSGLAPAQWSVYLMDTIGRKLWEGVPVTMVVSTPLDAGDSDGYSLMHNLADIPKVLLPRMCLNKTGDCPARAKKMLCKFLKLASVRIAKNMPTWKSGYAIALHSKVFLVDDAVFYIGSRNLYPSPLQNFGYIVEDATAAQHFKAAFFDRLWEYSKQAAIVDLEANKCELDGV